MVCSSQSIFNHAKSKQFLFYIFRANAYQIGNAVFEALNMVAQNPGRWLLFCRAAFHFTRMIIFLHSLIHVDIFTCISPLTLWDWIPLRRGVLNTILCDKACQWLAAALLFSLGNAVSSTNKTDCHEITEILEKVALNTITITHSRAYSKQDIILLNISHTCVWWLVIYSHMKK